MPQNKLAGEFADECVRARVELRRASQVLHDQMGSQLAAAGVHLQLLQMDFPAAAERAAQVAEALDGVMQCVRKLSLELEPSPVRRTGLKDALMELARSCGEESGARIEWKYEARGNLPLPAADAIYQVAARVMGSLASRGSRVSISVIGGRSLAIRIGVEHGRKAARGLEAAGIMARHAGLALKVHSSRSKTKKSTIVEIAYAVRRAPRR